MKKRNFTPIKNVREKYLKELKKDIELNVARRYKEITAPFVTDFEFEVIEEEGTELSIVTRPVLRDIERTTGNGGTVSSWVLFNTLDLGSSNAARVSLPDDFENESSPGSTTTQSSAYDRKEIFVDSTVKDQGMEARDWTNIVRNEYEPKLTKKVSALTKAAVNSALGIK